MAKTIIQSIGPLYGDVVNGTVFGRPNGSIYVPSVNTISVSLSDSYHYMLRVASGTGYWVCTSTGVRPTTEVNYLHVVAESQDVANYISIEIASDSDFTSLLEQNNRAAGIFNYATGLIGYDADSLPEIENGKTYYVRAVLYSSNGEPVATSSTIELTGYVAE